VAGRGRVCEREDQQCYTGHAPCGTDHHSAPRHMYAPQPHVTRQAISASLTVKLLHFTFCKHFNVVLHVSNMYGAVSSFKQ